MGRMFPEWNLALALHFQLLRQKNSFQSSSSQRTTRFCWEYDVRNWRESDNSWNENIITDKVLLIGECFDEYKVTGDRERFFKILFRSKFLFPVQKDFLLSSDYTVIKKHQTIPDDKKFYLADDSTKNHMMFSGKRQAIVHCCEW